MENKDKNIFHPLAKMMILESMRDKSRYYAHHEDFGHLTNDCRNLNGQVVFTIKRGGLQQYVKKVNGTPRMAEQSGPSTVHKEKTMAKQRTPVTEQQLRIVSMIPGPALVSEEEQTEEENGRKGKMIEVIGAFSQLCVCSKRILSSCSNSRHRAGSTYYKAATLGSSCSKTAG